MRVVDLGELRVLGRRFTSNSEAVFSQGLRLIDLVLGVDVQMVAFEFDLIASAIGVAPFADIIKPGCASHIVGGDGLVRRRHFDAVGGEGGSSVTSSRWLGIGAANRRLADSVAVRRHRLLGGRRR